MFATSLTWSAKPSITQPQCIATKDQKLVEDIRDFAKQHVRALHFLYVTTADTFSQRRILSFQTLGTKHHSLSSARISSVSTPIGVIM
jgi:hypothetical protein